MSKHAELVAVAAERASTWAALCLLAFAFTSAEPVAAQGSTAFGRKLGVYSLGAYENDWKPNVTPDPIQDPYYTFWDLMTPSITFIWYTPANKTVSQRLKDGKVDIRGIIPVASSPYKSWDDFDLVFFYGHNNTVPSPHVPGNLVDYDDCAGNTQFKDDHLWGTAAIPWECYGCSPVMSGQYWPGALTYLYYQCTSSLLGACKDYGGNYCIDPINGSSYRVHCGDACQQATYGKLGDKTLKWLILHGCQAVITATGSGTYNNTALRVFHPTHGKWHIVMGHWKSYYLSPNKGHLDGFAYALLLRQPIQPAYFDTDPDRNSSAIAAEKYSGSAFSWKSSTMANDAWGNPMAPNPGTTYYSQRWLAPASAWSKTPLIRHSPRRKEDACSYLVEPTLRTLDAGSSTGGVTVVTSSDCAWWVINTNRWIGITSPTNGTGSGTVGYWVDANPSANFRDGVVLIAGELFTVRQWGTSCEYLLSPSARVHGAGAETGTVTVAAGSGCPWRVGNTNSWIELVSGAGGTGDGSVGYRVAPNADANARSATFSIAGQLFTVFQWGTNCDYLLDPTAAVFGAGSATGIVGVVTHSECPWGVSNTNGWIWTTSPTNGTGSGNVGYAVAANLSPNARTGVVVIASLPFTVVQAADLLTMDAVPIESPEARALLGTDLLPFRQIKTAYVPTGLVPVLTLEAVTDDLCQQRLLKAVDLNFLGPLSNDQIRNALDLKVAANDESSCWVSRSSGAYAFTRLQNSMNIPTRFADYHEPVQIALAYMGAHRLVEPVEGEQVDLLYVSSVQNALVNADAPDTPLEEFQSDYYVAFGRRFRNVPIIGSELVLRLDGNGEVAMVRKNWRRITEVSSKQMTVSTNSLPALMIQDPRFYERYSQRPVIPQEISIVSMRCGYMEAPCSYRQKELRLGGSFSFTIGTNAAISEDLPQMTIALEDGGSLRSLLGSGYHPGSLTVQAYGTNGCTLLLESGGGYDYAIETSTNLTNWSRCGIVTNVSESATFVDQRPSAMPVRFYRAVELP